MSINRITKGYAIMDMRRMEPYIPVIWETRQEAEVELIELLRHTTNAEWRRRLVIKRHESDGRKRNLPTEWVRPVSIPALSNSVCIPIISSTESILAEGQLIAEV